MNFRNTAILFALLLTSLWVFGVMLATKQPAAEEGFLFPTLKTAESVTITALTLDIDEDGKRATHQIAIDKDTSQLTSGSLTTMVVKSKVDGLVRTIRQARHNIDADLSSDLAGIGLSPPRRVITLKGFATDKSGLKGKEESWTLSLGKPSKDGTIVYALSSERPGEVFALAKSEVESLLFADPVSLKSQVFFNFALETPAAQRLKISAGKDVLELSRTPDGLWRFDQPPGYGYAQYEMPPPLKGLVPKEKAAEGGVKGLIFAIRPLKVAEETDFLPLGKAGLDAFGLEEGKEAMRIEVDSVEDKVKAKEVLLIGKTVPDTKGGQVYARLAGDPAVARISAAQLEPIKDALFDPARLRSRELTFAPPDRLRGIQIEQGGKRVELSSDNGKDWLIERGGSKRKANNAAVDELLSTLRGKSVETFETPKDPKSAEKEFGVDAPQLVVKVVESPEEGKKEGKERTTQLFFGKKAAADAVYVKRVMPDGEASFFQVLAKTMNAITGDDLTLTFLDTALPRADQGSVIAMTLTRGGKTIELKRDFSTVHDRWLMRETGASGDFVPADAGAAESALSRLSRLRAVRWLRPLDAKEDLKPLGLAEPSLTATLVVMDLPVLAHVIGAGPTLGALGGLAPLGAAAAALEPAPAGAITIRLGVDNKLDGEKRGVYATQSESDMLFLVEPAIVEALRKAEFRDTDSLLALQPCIVSGLVMQAADHPLNLLGLGAPILGGRMHVFDPAKVKEVKLLLRTPAELRQLAFARDLKTKEGAWQDRSGLLEFDLDGARVDAFLKQLAEAEPMRAVSIGAPRADQKLDPKGAALRIELTLDDGRTLSLAVGGMLAKTGHYAQTSAQPDVVFLLPPSLVAGWTSGPAMFAREKVAGAE